MIGDWDTEPLEEKAQLLRDIPTFRRMTKQLSAEFRMDEEPAMSVNGTNFAAHSVLMVDVPVSFVEDGRIVCEVETDRAKVTFVPLPGSEIDGELPGYGKVFQGFRYFLEVPREVDEVQVETYPWTEDLLFTQGCTADTPGGEGGA